MIMMLRDVSSHSCTGIMCYLPPGDGPLLKTNELSSLAWRRNFRNVDWNLSRTDTDTEAINHTANDEHGNVLRGADDDASNDPDDGSDLDCNLAWKVRTRVSVEWNVTIYSMHLRPRRSDR
jgi:hypothetical protein